MMINKPRNDSEPDLRFQIKHFKRNPSIIMVVEAGCCWGEAWRCDNSNKHSPEHGAFSNFHYKSHTITLRSTFRHTNPNQLPIRADLICPLARHIYLPKQLFRTNFTWPGELECLGKNPGSN